MSEAPVDLFIATLPLFGEEPSPDDWALVTADEKAFARGLPAFEGRDFVHVRGFLRRTLGAHLGVAPAEISWMPNATGKPELEGGHGLHFSYAYHDTCLAVLVACTEFPLGVDAGEFIDAEDADEFLFERFPQLASQCSDPSVCFARAWTQWEALLKAHGTGFTERNPDAGLCRVDAVPLPVKRALSEDELPPSAWRTVRYEEQSYALLELAHSQPVACTVALRCAGESPRVRLTPFKERTCG